MIPIDDNTLNSRAGKRVRDHMHRSVHCLFGLPVDDLSMARVKQSIRRQALARQGVVISTVNINWLVSSWTHPEFRNAILNSDMVVLDGKPLLWLAQLFGCPMRQTVAGSTLLQELLEEKAQEPLTIFLFGGAGNTAQRAMTRINDKGGGLRAVGALNPGYGDIAEMSTNQIIDTINNANPDILLVALGAAKGVAWIETNRYRLRAGVISHLGATINFLAGTIQRAPRAMQVCGMEWFWRILQEPALLARYAADGARVARMLIAHAPLWLQFATRNRRGAPKREETIRDWHENANAITIFLGEAPDPDHPDGRLRALFTLAGQARKDLIMDLQYTKHLGSAFLGLCLIAGQWQKRNQKQFAVINIPSRLRQTFEVFTARKSSTGEKH